MIRAEPGLAEPRSRARRSLGGLPHSHRRAATRTPAADIVDGRLLLDGRDIPLPHPSGHGWPPGSTTATRPGQPAPTSTCSSTDEPHHDSSRAAPPLEGQRRTTTRPARGPHPPRDTRHRRRRTPHPRPFRGSASNAPPHDRQTLRPHHPNGSVRWPTGRRFVGRAPEKDSRERINPVMTVSGDFELTMEDLRVVARSVVERAQCVLPGVRRRTSKRSTTSGRLVGLRQARSAASHGGRVLGSNRLKDQPLERARSHPPQPRLPLPRLPPRRVRATGGRHVAGMPRL